MYSETADRAIKVSAAADINGRSGPAMLQEYSRSLIPEKSASTGRLAALIRAIAWTRDEGRFTVVGFRELRRKSGGMSNVERRGSDALFMLRENGREFSARALSEGTLRFAAITAAFFQPDMPGMMTIEEIESGIHPSRLRLLVELLRSRAGHGETQVFATTHSPTTLAWLQERLSDDVVCKRDDETGESRIRPLIDVPHFTEVAKKCPPSELFAEGWLEAAL